MPGLKLAAGVVLAGLGLACWSAEAGTHFAGDAARDNRAAYAPASLTAPLWTAALPAEPQARHEFEPLTTPVYAAGRVFAVGRRYEAGLHVATRLLAFRVADGAPAWASELPPDLFGSWASPAVDLERRQVIVASGRVLRAVDWSDGALRWEVVLPRAVVNASPAVSTGLVHAAPANRVFITDYAPFAAGTLYAVNLDPYDPFENPFEPGEIAWSATLGGTSGSTPASADGLVVCADTAGAIRAFDGRAGGLLWTRVVSGGGGFFGGVAIRDGAVYAATYNFSGGQNNSRLVKLRLADGALLWQVACERTDAIPVVTDEHAGERRVYLSGGIAGFGSVLKVQAFRDLGDAAALAWDTHVDSSGALAVGGWNFQPLLAGGRLWVGAPLPGAPGEPYERLLALDLERAPGQPGFVQAERLGSGGSPSIGGGRLFSIGAAAGETAVLSAFAAAPLGDLNCDGRVDFADIDGFVLALIGADPYYEVYPECAHDLGDADLSGAVDFADIDAFVQLLVAGS